MVGSEWARGASELARARAGQNGLLISAVLFSVFINLLMLTGPLYMLQVYDRVLGSRSEATLVALTALVAFLFLAMGVLDHARGRVLARIGARSGPPVPLGPTAADHRCGVQIGRRADRAAFLVRAPQVGRCFHRRRVLRGRWCSARGLGHF